MTAERCSRRRSPGRCPKTCRSFRDIEETRNTTMKRSTFAPAAFAAVLLASMATGIAAPSAQRSLTFEDRVAAQRAIEQVYWNHRIWPQENSGSKPSLSDVLPDA